MAIKTLYGAPVKYIEHTDKWGPAATPAEAWAELNAAIARGDVVTTVSDTEPNGSDSD